MLLVFHTSIRSFCLRGIHFDMASEKTNSARYGSQARKMIKRMYNVCREEKKDGKLSLPLCSPLKRTTQLCDVRRIQKEKKTEEPLTEVRPRKFQLDDFDLCVLRRTIQTMYEKHQVFPALENIRKGLLEAISFTGSKKVLSSALKRIDFQYRRCTTNRKILMERSDVVAQRISYLRNIKRLREAGYTIIYTEETCVHSSHSVLKSGWSGGAMVLGKLPMPGRPTIWITVGQGPTARPDID